METISASVMAIYLDVLAEGVAALSGLPVECLTADRSLARGRMQWMLRDLTRLAVQAVQIETARPVHVGKVWTDAFEGHAGAQS